MIATSFVCSICGDPAAEICVYCTKDACGNHLCAKCRRCSDCCECTVALEEPLPAVPESPPEESTAALESEAIASAEVPDDPDSPVPEDLTDSEASPKSDTPPGSASS